MLLINATAIFDQPRFAHRGLLIDSARHFLPLSVIKDNLEAMAAAKMNVLHWHIVDDQSFPYQSNALPRLAEYGAFSHAHTYRPTDIQEVVQYARDRGIRVIPEFDTPGHTASWGKGYPGLLTDCYNEKEQPTGEKGPVNPVRNETYALLWAFLREAAGLFPDTYLHLGGDEVPFDCWQSSPEIRAWMREHDVSSIAGLETYFEERVLALASAAGRSYIVWQEPLDNGVKLDSNTVVHVWKWWWPVSATEATVEGGAEMNAVAQKPAGYRALLSSPWYLNLGPYAGEAWVDYYTVEPLEFDATPAQASLVIGGEACMWGEWVDGSNLMERTWPRAAAVAERLWSARDVRDVDAARPRIAEHRCRMLARGLAASPGTGPGYCPQDTSL
ncbi:putative beta-N-acetylhexosaminidase [Coccomyxa subellipsoidea C-169]|uniref:beta-N-acetylhexosaminidase n=1 Tax=Coccomyxa subellipsoidea (strain C-169) TaxID=574566 RepID=I0YYH5_COCSC|nr:putative beta-N-acetylhexosaminidase [Coccomyxa subellipsoidea C-169]EIE23444.1 putative beta-N-acetylhexosaminidase [Coccomyxa subellipsoidea C-169]|eukprot:XP_005647988.1 putative beta-N-acetylhexosaminidase [Coccomyxa subellipsoidea C-169]